VIVREGSSPSVPIK